MKRGKETFFSLVVLYFFQRNLSKKEKGDEHQLDNENQNIRYLIQGKRLVIMTFV